MGEGNEQIESTTIVAVATPPGRGGVGIVRLSGPEALRIAAALFPNTPAAQPRTAHYRLLHDGPGTRIDDALITAFPAPASYTGEDVVEIATHGSPVVQDWLLRTCVEHGAVPARPGEFTERAFLNGRLDLTGAEAVRDLIDAQTLGQAQVAAAQMGGSVAQRIRPVKAALIGLIAQLEADVDFAEDDLNALGADAIQHAIGELQPPLDTLLSTFDHGRVLREGLRLAIVGEPNVGKSSLFNRLLQQERAIVTGTPGTTRDVIAERLVLDGIPVELLDTAGLREGESEAERIGIERSRQALADADAVLLVLDACRPQPAQLPFEQLLAGRSVIVVWNKADLCSRGQLPAQPLSMAWPAVVTSAVTGEGFELLKGSLLTLARGGSYTPNGATLTNLRQHGAVQRAGAALARAKEAAANATPHEMILLDLYDALHALDELTGETTPDDVLHLIFSTFCIGK